MKAYNETYYTKPIAMNMVEDNGKIWMSLLNRNGICEIDKVRGEARICRIFDGEPYDGKFLYSYVVKVSHYLIFSPWEAKNIAIYNLECDSMIYTIQMSIYLDMIIQQLLRLIWILAR